MMQSNYLYVILRVKRQKLFILAFFNLIFNSLFQDGDHVW